MKFITIFSVFVLILLSIVSHGVEGGSRKLRQTEEDVELETQVNSLNKPPIHSFKNKYGETIDCIDIYKQPAFDHPLLKDHKLQMRPSSLPKGMEKLRREDKISISRQSDQSKYEVCPYGTVPFKRVTKEDLIRAKTSFAALNPTAFQQPPNPHFVAASTPTDDPSKQIWGAAASISVYNLTIQKDQYSQALLSVGTGITGPFNSIEYGWTVNEGLYGDGLSRTYSVWTGDGLQSTGCYNALCPGYVQVSQKRLMGEPNKPVTIPGEDVYAMDFKIFKDPKTSNWWLFENLGDEANEPVGYWPKELFPKMSNFASLVQLGGKVATPNGAPNPAMGSGVYMPDDFTRTCYASNIQFVNQNNEFYDPKDEPMAVLGDDRDTYQAAYLGDASKDHPGRGYTLVFGGPAIR